MKRVAAALPALLLAACLRPAQPLPTFKTVPEFTLTSQSSQEFSSRNLAGKVWIADFVFTNCSGPCPRMSSQMRQMQTGLREYAAVRFVSFTVDPARDTPEALAAYAQRYQADPERWHFLTGPRETLHQLMREAFMLGDVSGNLEHSTRFVLIDQHGRVRGYYASSEPDGIRKLIGDARRLIEERS
jgi:protein SCO1/2